jgi:hypothetical protein
MIIAVPVILMSSPRLSLSAFGDSLTDFLNRLSVEPGVRNIQTVMAMLPVFLQANGPHRSDTRHRLPVMKGRR